MKVYAEGLFNKEGIREIELSLEQQWEFDKRIKPLLDAWRNRSIQVADLLELCRDCYMQGLVDGSDQDVLELIEEERNRK